MSNEPICSIVIRTLNSAPTLPKVLAMLERQRERCFEVVLVDSGSSDRTVEIAREARNRIPLRIARLPRKDFSFGTAINVGLQNSPGQFGVVLSSHCIPATAEWLGRLLRPLHDSSQCAAAYGRKLIPDTADPYLRLAVEESPYFAATSRIESGPAPRFSNSCSAIRRDVWSEHPFESGIHAEDRVWAAAVAKRGWKIAYVADAPVLHMQYHREKFWQILRREYGCAAAVISRTEYRNHIDFDISPGNVFKHVAWRIPRKVVGTFRRQRFHPRWLVRALSYEYGWYIGPAAALIQLKRRGELGHPDR